jgi:hypothetical protein
VKVTFASSWPAKANVNNGGRKTLAKNSHVGQVTVMTHRVLPGLITQVNGAYNDGGTSRNKLILSLAYGV